MSSQPLNVIILTSDEMRGDCPGFMGNPECQTPHLDRFAERGIVFENHFTVHGKCVPSRIAMMTGRYSHTDGFRTITQHLPPDDPNLLSLLRAHGYETAVFGINHVWETLHDSKQPHVGYADYHSFVGHYQAMAFQSYPIAQPGSDDIPPDEIDLLGRNYVRRIQGENTLAGFSDDARTDQAIDYLTRTRDRSKPFYLHVNLSKPHPKYEAEEPYFSMYDRDGIQAWPHDLPQDAPLHMRVMREVRTGIDAPAAAFRELQAVYYAMITKVDTLFGKLFDTIAAEGLFENSIIVFLSDHGDFAGQYGLVEKWDTAMADCIMHVPFVIYAPNLPHGSRVNSLTEHTDLAPTLLDLLDIKPEWGMHGETLLPIIHGERRKPAVFADGGHEEEMWGRFNVTWNKWENIPVDADGKQVTYRDYPETMARTKMVRTERWKLVMRLAGGNELYDMLHDPHELTNLWPHHADDAELMRVVLDLQQQLIEWSLRTDTDRPYQADVGA